MTTALEEARIHLEAWKAADLAVASGKSYRIGSRQLQRADVSEIRGQINYWQKKINKLSGVTRRKVYYGVPVD